MTQAGKPVIEPLDARMACLVVEPSSNRSDSQSVQTRVHAVKLSSEAFGFHEHILNPTLP